MRTEDTYKIKRISLTTAPYTVYAGLDSFAVYGTQNETKKGGAYGYDGYVRATTSHASH